MPPSELDIGVKKNCQKIDDFKILSVLNLKKSKQSALYIIALLFCFLFSFVYFSFWFYGSPSRYFYFHFIFFYNPTDSSWGSSNKEYQINKYHISTLKNQSVIWFLVCFGKTAELQPADLQTIKTKKLLWFCKLWSSMRSAPSFFKKN